MHGLSGINIELTSRCNKSCHMCGRRKEEAQYPDIANNRGDMPFEMLERIESQIPPGVFIQLHNNGEPLLYPQFAGAYSNRGAAREELGDHVGAIEDFTKAIEINPTLKRLIDERSD